MRQQVQRAEQLAPACPHPGAPDAELFHKLAGSEVGLIDRLPDRLAGRSS
jgi:hypothetical protein